MQTSLKQYAIFHMARRDPINVLHLGGRLWQKWLVVMAARMEFLNLQFHRKKSQQAKYRAETTLGTSYSLHLLLYSVHYWNDVVYGSKIRSTTFVSFHIRRRIQF